MPQRVVPSIKLKDALGEPTVAIQTALNAGTITKNPNGMAAPGQFVPMGYLVGYVSDQVEHETKRRGPGGLDEVKTYPKLAGQFKAWSVDPARDEHVSPHVFLMDHLTLHLGGLIRAAKAEDPNARLEILFEVGAETSDKSSTGFTWAMRNMAQPAVTADPLAALAARVQGKSMSALPGPAADETSDEGHEGSDLDAERQSDEQEQADRDNADAVSKDTGAGKVDKGDARGGQGKRR